MATVLNILRRNCPLQHNHKEPVVITMSPEEVGQLQCMLINFKQTTTSEAVHAQIKALVVAMERSL